MLAMVDLKWKINIDLECDIILCKNIDVKLLGLVRFTRSVKCDSYNLLPSLILRLCFPKPFIMVSLILHIWFFETR